MNVQLIGALMLYAISAGIIGGFLIGWAERTAFVLMSSAIIATVANLFYVIIWGMVNL